VIKYPLVEFHHIEHDEWDQNKEVENQWECISCTQHEP
jgi:hypothetical protein